MPTLPIKIEGGLFLNADSFEIGGSGLASKFKNGLIDDAGANIGRPAWNANPFATIGNFPIIGLAWFNSKVLAIDENRDIWELDSDGTVTQKTGTALLEGSNRPVFANDGALLAIAGGGAPKTWDGSADTISMAGNPADCTHINYLDGYWINHLLDDQEFRIAGPTTATRLIWNTTDFFQAEGLPDNVVSQMVLLREFYGFGAESTEIYFNYGDTVTPFKRSFFIDKGVIAPYSVIDADNTLWWLDSDRRFVKMVNRTPTLISTPLDREIRGFSTVSDCWAARIDIGGFYLIVWTFPTEERTFVYDYKSNYWGEWDGYFEGNVTRMKIHSHVFAKSWNKHLIGDPTTGVVRELTFDENQDGSRVRRFLREIGPYDHGTGNRKRSNWYEFAIKRGEGSSEGETPLLSVRVKDDNKPWSAYEHVDLGAVGDFNPLVRVRMRGIYRVRTMEIVITDAVEFRMIRLVENVDPMVS